MFSIDRLAALVYTMSVKRKGGIVMYLMYNGDGIFLGMVTESLGYDIFKENPDYRFIEIPESLDYNEETDEWKLPPASLRVF